MLTYNKDINGLKKIIVVLTDACLLIGISAGLWILVSLFQVFILHDISLNSSISAVWLCVVVSFVLMNYGIIHIDWEKEFKSCWWNY